MCMRDYGEGEERDENPFESIYNSSRQMDGLGSLDPAHPLFLSLSTSEGEGGKAEMTAGRD